MSEIDVLLVNPPSFEKGVVIIRDMDRHGRVSIEKTIWPQSTLASIAAHVARAGLSVDILDCIAVKMDWDEFEAVLRRRRPRYVAFNCVSSTFHNDMQVAQLGKELGVVTLAGGTHVAAETRGTLEEYPELDVAVINEFEESIGETISHLEQRKPLDDVLGIGFRAGDRIQVNERRPTPKTLEDLPIPLHEKLPLEKYNLPFILLSDPDHEVAEAYGAWGEKKMYGKMVKGIIRSHFAIDERGKITELKLKVKPETTADFALQMT